MGSREHRALGFWNEQTEQRCSWTHRMKFCWMNEWMKEDVQSGGGDPHHWEYTSSGFHLDAMWDALDLRQRSNVSIS